MDFIHFPKENLFIIEMKKFNKKKLLECKKKYVKINAKK